MKHLISETRNLPQVCKELTTDGQFLSIEVPVYSHALEGPELLNRQKTLYMYPSFTPDIAEFTKNKRLLYHPLHPF
jgi:hypothetical protein